LSAPLPTAARPSLSADRINYLVGETPFYEIKNAPPDEPLHWLITRDGEQPLPYAHPAQRTDVMGNWSGNGGVWTHDSAGFYSIEAHVGAWIGRAQFTVVDVLPRGPDPRTTAASLIGIVHVAGEYRFAGRGTPFGEVPFLVEGAQQILSLGARRGFFYLTPQYKSSDYPFDDFGPEPIRTLTELAGSPPYRMLFALPFDQFVLTTYTFANWNWALDRAQGGRSVPLLADGETAELADIVAHLAASYPEKEFILKNWEGDWVLQENYDIEDIPTPERIHEGSEWMRARQAGVVQGRARAAGENIRHAIEFNLLSRSVRDEPGMLTNVVRDVYSDLISYSAWETSNLFDTRRMKDAITYIERSPASRGRKVLVAEFGDVTDPPDPKTEAHVDALLRAFVDMGTTAFYWEIFNNGVPYGLIGPDYRRSYAWFALRRALGGKNTAIVVSDPALTNVPETMHAGETVQIRATFRNTGSAWYRSVMYQLELLGPSREDLGQVAWLPYDVATSDQATFHFEFTAPALPGTYHFQMAQRGIEFFGDVIAFVVIDADRSNTVGP
jgi:hypothetical protein